MVHECVCCVFFVWLCILYLQNELKHLCSGHRDKYKRMMGECLDNEPIRFLMILFLSFFYRDYERCYQEGEEEGRMEGERTALWVMCSFGP